MSNLQAKCGHCEKFGTKTVQIEPQGASYKLIAICCAHCNAVLGVMDYYNTGAVLKQIEKKIDKLLGRHL